MNRYEEILTRLVAARIAYGTDPVDAADSVHISRAANILEAHFVERDIEAEHERWKRGGVPILLKRLAE